AQRRARICGPAASPVCLPGTPMKITIELFHDELLPHQRGALAVLLNPVAPKPLVGGAGADVSELVPGSDDLDSVPAPIKRSEVVLRVGDKVKLRAGPATEVTG